MSQPGTTPTGGSRKFRPVPRFHLRDPVTSRRSVPVVVVGKTLEGGHGGSHGPSYGPWHNLTWDLKNKGTFTRRLSTFLQLCLSSREDSNPTFLTPVVPTESTNFSERTSISSALDVRFTFFDLRILVPLVCRPFRRGFSSFKLSRPFRTETGFFPYTHKCTHTYTHTVVRIHTHLYVCTFTDPDTSFVSS